MRHQLWAIAGYFWHQGPRSKSSSRSRATVAWTIAPCNHRGDRLGKPLRPLTTRDQDVLGAAVAQLGHYPQPEFREFGLLDPQPKDLFRVRWTPLCRMRLITLSVILSCRVPVLPLTRRRDPAQDCSTAIRSLARSGELHTHGERLRQTLGRRYRINYCKNRSFFCGPLTLGSSTSTLVRRFDAGLKRIMEMARSPFQFLRRWTRTKKQGFSQHPERRWR